MNLIAGTTGELEERVTLICLEARLLKVVFQHLPKIFTIHSKVICQRGWSSML